MTDSNATELLPCKAYTDEWRKKISEARKGYKAPGEHLYRDNPRLAGVYDSIKQRCYNPKRENYERYGGRGITMCDEWRADSSAFIRWALDNGYCDGLQLDRIDNDGQYSPENCRWVTPSENCRNTRRAKNLTLFGETKSIAEWCESIPISQYTIYDWYRHHGKEGCEKRVYERLSKIA